MIQYKVPYFSQTIHHQTLDKINNNYYCIYEKFDHTDIAYFQFKYSQCQEKKSNGLLLYDITQNESNEVNAETNNLTVEEENRECQVVN